MTKTEYLEQICADLGIDVSALPDRLIGTYLGAIKERLGMLNWGGTIGQYLEAITQPYNAGVADGIAQCQQEGHDAAYNAGRDAGRTEGYNEGYEAGIANAAPAAPTTPTDNRTSLRYWYQYLADNWGRGVNWDTYEEIEYGEPLEELEYPTGTQNVTNMVHFFSIFTSYEDLAGGTGYEMQGIPAKKMIGVLDLPKVTSVSYLLNECRVIEDLGTIVFHQPLTDVSFMCSYCYELTKMNLVGFDTSQCTQFDRMFYYCSAITTVPSFDTSKGKSFSMMFGGCTNLRTIERLDLTNATSVMSMFTNCINLEHIGITGTISLSLGLANSTKLSHDTLVAILNALVPKTSGTWKLTIGSTNIAKLTQEELDIATTKGWQVV